MTPEEYLTWLDAAIARMELGAPAMARAMAAVPGGPGGHRHAAADHSRAGGLSQGCARSAARIGVGEPSPVHVHHPRVAGGPVVGDRREQREVRELLEHGGCVLQPTSRSVMHWRDSGGSWYHARLPATGEFPPHPFLQPTVEEVIADGSLSAVAIAAFRPFDP